MASPFSAALMHCSQIIAEAKRDVDESGVCTSWWFRDDAACSAARRAVSDLYRYQAEAESRAAAWDPSSPTAAADAQWIIARLDLVVESGRYYSRIAREISWAEYRKKCLDDVGRLVAAAANEAAAAAGEGVRGFFRHLSPGGWAAVGLGLVMIFGLPAPVRRVVRRKA